MQTINKRFPTQSIWLAALMLALLASYEKAEADPIVIEYRPFAVFNESLLQNADGWFDATQGPQKIGIFLKNTGAPVTNVQGVLSFPGGSGIVPIADTYSFGDMAPGISVLGIFEADFTGVVPAKYAFTLELTGDGGFADTVSRDAFVAASSIIDPTTFSVTIPQGTIVGEHLSFYGGSDVQSLMAPTMLRWTMTPTVPFEGQFSELPYQDPWWKAFGAGMVIGSAINMIIDGIAEKCGSDYMDPATEKINIGLGVAGGGAAAADLIDPFRRGEENTFPLPTELTTSEEVIMWINYDAPPTPRDPFTGTVQWTFTRHTTGNSYQYDVVEPFLNEHFTVGRATVLEDDTLSRGDTLIVAASASDESGFLSGSDAYVTATISKKCSDQQKHYLTTLIMHDDGTHGDVVAGDGNYTGMLPIDGGFTPGQYVYDVFFQDVNQAPEGIPPLEAATYLGGFIVSHPSELLEGPLGSCSLFGDGIFEVGPDWQEDFDSYAAGSSLHGQSGWKGWDNDPSFAAPVTGAQASSTPHSADVSGDADLVHEICGVEPGAWSFTAWQYIPADFASGGSDQFAGTYFVLLNTYRDGGPYDWSVQMQFDSNDGMLKVYHGDGVNTIDVPYVTDRWVKIEAIVDLENDWTQVYYDDTLITEYSWTGGALGEGGGALDIGAVDLYANGSTSVFYDDLMLAPILTPCPGDLDGDGDVDLADLSRLLTNYGTASGMNYEDGDLDSDGDVDLADLAALLSVYGTTCE